MAKGSNRSAAPGSPVGDRHFHLSVPYLRSQRGGYGSQYRRPSAKELRAGMALGHPRPGGRADAPATMPQPAKPGTQQISCKCSQAVGCPAMFCPHYAECVAAGHGRE